MKTRTEKEKKIKGWTNIFLPGGRRYHFWDLQTNFFKKKCVSNNFFLLHFVMKTIFYDHFEHKGFAIHIYVGKNNSCAFIHMEKSRLNKNKFILYKPFVGQ